mmetsp:Transcript_127544/g.190089  ORF Transcript_127544/g.190089 Transcript_127544/m.190089 type:complete len:235 (-) Transcript_127544:8-712(-)
MTDLSFMDRGRDYGVPSAYGTFHETQPVAPVGRRVSIAAFVPIIALAGIALVVIGAGSAAPPPEMHVPGQMNAVESRSIRSLMKRMNAVNGGSLGQALAAEAGTTPATTTPARTAAPKTESLSDEEKCKHAQHRLAVATENMLLAESGDGDFAGRMAEASFSQLGAVREVRRACMFNGLDSLPDTLEITTAPTTLATTQATTEKTCAPCETEAATTGAATTAAATTAAATTTSK